MVKLTDIAVAGTKRLLQPLFEDNDMFLAFLPLAHILEMVRGMLTSGADGSSSSLHSTLLAFQSLMEP